MRIPTCNEVRVRCICCGKVIEPDDDHCDDSVNVALWNNGLVTLAHGTFRSKTNGKSFVMAICDECVIIKEREERLYCFYNRLNFEGLPIEDDEKPLSQFLEFNLNYNPLEKENNAKEN